MISISMRAIIVTVGPDKEFRREGGSPKKEARSQKVEELTIGISKTVKLELWKFELGELSKLNI